MKKMLSLILSLALVFSCFAGTAVFAENSDELVTLFKEFASGDSASNWSTVSEPGVTWQDGYDVKWTPGTKLNTGNHFAQLSGYTSPINLEDVLTYNPDATVNVRYKTTSEFNFAVSFFWLSGKASWAGGVKRYTVTGDGTWQIFTTTLSELIENATADRSTEVAKSWNKKNIYLGLDNVNPATNGVGVFTGTESDSVYVDSWWLGGLDLNNLPPREKYEYTVTDGNAYITGYTSLLTDEELTHLVIPETVGSENQYTVVSVTGFEGNTKIQSVTLPDTVTTVASKAFYQCKNLKKATLPAVAVIEASAFRECGISMINSDKTGEIIFPETLTTIGWGAFRLSNSVKNVFFSPNITSVGDYAFYRSTGIDSFYFPDTMTMLPTSYYNLYDGLSGMDDVKIYASSKAEVLKYADDPKAVDKYYTSGTDGVSDGNKLYDNPVIENGDILVLEKNYTDSDGMPISGTSKTVGADGVAFSGYAFNKSNTAENFTLVLTVKSAEKELKAISTAVHSLGAYTTGNIGCELMMPEGTAIEDGDEIRVIILTNLETIVPMSTVYNGMTVDADIAEYNVMAIGNSFAQDSMIHLKNIAAADGILINSYDCYIGGQSLAGHYERLQADDDAYTVLPEGATSEKKISIKNMLNYRDWDYVLLQGTTHSTFFDESLWNDDAESWTALTEAVEAYAPDAKRYVHATWAPYSEQAAVVQTNNPDYIPDDVNLDARGDYTKALIPHQEFGAEIFSTESRYDNSGKKAYIPTMVAVDYAIRHFGFDEHTGTLKEGSGNSYWDNTTTTGIFRDTTCHLSQNVGRVLAGLVWYEMLTGNDVRDNAYTNDTLTDEQMTMLKEAAHYACTNYASYNPSEITAQ